MPHLDLLAGLRSAALPDEDNHTHPHTGRANTGNFSDLMDQASPADKKKDPVHPAPKPAHSLAHSSAANRPNIITTKAHTIKEGELPETRPQHKLTPKNRDRAVDSSLQGSEKNNHPKEAVTHMTSPEQPATKPTLSSGNNDLAENAEENDAGTPVANERGGESPVIPPALSSGSVGMDLLPGSTALANLSNANRTGDLTMPTNPGGQSQLTIGVLSPITSSINAGSTWAASAANGQFALGAGWQQVTSEAPLPTPIPTTPTVSAEEAKNTSNPDNTNNLTSNETASLAQLLMAGVPVANNPQTLPPPVTPEDVSSALELKMADAGTDQNEAAAGDNNKLSTVYGAKGTLLGARPEGGTGVAIDGLSMKKSENMNKVAGTEEQVLPVGNIGTAPKAVSTGRSASIPVQNLDAASQPINLPISSGDLTGSKSADTATSINLSSLNEIRQRDVEQTHEMIALHAIRVVQTKADSLQVVLRPDGGTELALDVRHRNGTVEAQATLQNGDYELMNRHWAELQQKLEQRGIKLSALGSENEPTDFGRHSGSSQRQPADREAAAQEASAFAEFTIAMNRGGASACLATATPTGWESWA